MFHTLTHGVRRCGGILNEAAKLGIEVKASYGYSRNTPVEEVQKEDGCGQGVGDKSIFIHPATP